MMIDAHTADTSCSRRSSRSTPIRLASSTLTACGRYSTAACRNAGEVMMIRTVHIIRSAESSPGGAAFVLLYMVT